GFPLVGDADGGDSLRRCAAGAHDVPHDVEDGGPDLFRIVLHPSRPGIDLPEFLPGCGHGFSAPVEQNRPGTRRALVQGQDVRFLHDFPPPFRLGSSTPIPSIASGPQPAGRFPEPAALYTRTYVWYTERKQKIYPAPGGGSERMKPFTEPIAAKTVLNPVRAPSMPFRWSVNPYRGCRHGCSFCYARSTHLYLDQPADDTFQRHIFWKAGAPDILRGQLERLAKLGKLPDHVAVGTATDPYQPLEAEARLTRGCLEVLAEFGVPFSVTTRSPLVLRDLDILRAAPAKAVNI